MINLNDENCEEEVLSKEGLFLIDFWSPMCSACQKMKWILDNVAKEMAGRAIFGKLNIFEGPRIAKKYKIPATPTLIIFKDGEPIERAVGLRSEQVLIKKLKFLIQ